MAKKQPEPEPVPAVEYPTRTVPRETLEPLAWTYAAPALAQGAKRQIEKVWREGSGQPWIALAVQRGPAGVIERVLAAPLVAGGPAGAEDVWYDKKRYAMGACCWFCPAEKVAAPVDIGVEVPAAAPVPEGASPPDVAENPTDEAAPPAPGPGPDDTAVAREHLAKIEEIEKRVRALEGDYLDAREAATDAKKAFEAADKELRDLIAAGSRRLPLFEPETPASVPPVPEPMPWRN